MAHRYFTSDISAENAIITGSDASHLAKVLRVKTGDCLTLCDGKGRDYTGQITQVEPDRIVFTLLSSAPTKAEPSLQAKIYAGMAKGEKLEVIIQKCVELGAHDITPFYSEFTVVKPKNDRAKQVRWQRIAEEAAKQSGRGIIPQVHLPLSFADMLVEAAGCDTALFLYEKGGLPLAQSLQKAHSLAIITGPEGGFSEKEAQMAQQAGCVPTGLGPRILRCETAPLAALAVAMALTGNLE